MQHWSTASLLQSVAFKPVRLLKCWKLMLFDRADNENGKRALLRVAKRNQTGFFQVLLWNVVGINEELDFDGLIALNEATLFNYRVITDILLKQGTVSSTDNKDQKPLN